MNILSIESSCDESAISILEAKGGVKKTSFKILGNNIASQVKLHAQYGGVFPMMAKREHAKNLIPLLKKTLKEAKILYPVSGIEYLVSKKVKIILNREPELLEQFLEFIPTIQKPNIDAIAVTYGPGLEPALWVGINFAKALAIVWDIPVIPVNHMEGHILSALKKGGNKFSISNFQFPMLSLLISGGHTELVLVKKWMNYKIIGETRDDAVGEAFDKVARMLNLPYPGGPQISKLAGSSRSKSGKTPGVKDTPTPEVEEDFDLFPPVKLPRPMINSGDFDFSFSGLKTAVLYLLRELGKLNNNQKIAIAKEFQDAATEVLTSKTMKAAKKFKVRTILVGGGVSANKQIRTTLIKAAKKEKINIHFPEKGLSVDNSIMIGMAGYFRFLSKSKKPNIRTLKACGNLKIGTTTL